MCYNEKMKIGVFDSGKGGTTVLTEIEKAMPTAEYQYIGDSENCPYGDKSDEELMRIVRGHTERLKNWGARIIVIACNTATTRCIARLRAMYPEIEFVGTEPAVKLAAESGAKKILVMATAGTIASERTRQLTRENQKPGQEIYLLPCPGLADAIEKNEKPDETLDAVLADYLETQKQPDAVVLGCTHYSLIKEKIAKHFPDAKIIDGNIGVKNRVLEIIKRMEKQ